MNLIYGYDDELMIKLIEHIKTSKNKNLTAVFREFALKENKSAGTIRNLYYAISKRAETDTDFKNKYLLGVEFKTNKAKKFSKENERELIKKIMLERLNTRSTRSAVYKIANGDGKTALRYQNKYRAVLKNNESLIGDIKTEIEKECGVKIPIFSKTGAPIEYGVNKVKDEINALIERIAKKVKAENSELKKENAFLKSEISRLSMLINSKDTAFAFFKKEEEISKIN